MMVRPFDPSKDKFVRAPPKKASRAQTELGGIGLGTVREMREHGGLDRVQPGEILSFHLFIDSFCFILARSSAAWRNLVILFIH